MSHILIDLSILRHPFCGLGQIALNYGRWYGRYAAEHFAGHDITLLVPKDYVGQFGDKVHYLPMRDVYRIIPQLMPHFDVWHSIHQLSPFRPANHDTRHLLTIHDVNFVYEKHGHKRQRYLQRLQNECDSATEICFISRFAQKDASQYLTLHGKPQHIIYNGVENMTDGDQQKPISINIERPFFLCLGVVKEKKNIHTLLPVMRKMNDYNLIIAGNDTDPYVERLRNEAQGMGNIHIIGTVSDEERRWLYAHCSALMMPSLCEGFGLPVIEAMQWGKPVFCSTSTSLPEIGSSHAFYFNSFEPDDMEETIRQGLANFSKEQADAVRNYAATFSYERHMQQYATILNRLANLS